MPDGRIGELDAEITVRWERVATLAAQIQQRQEDVHATL
jgi:hypothetical protein